MFCPGYCPPAGAAASKATAINQPNCIRRAMLPASRDFTQSPNSYLFSLIRGRRTAVGADRLVLLVKMPDRLGRREVEDRSPRRDPAASAPGENCGRAPQIADRRQPLHVAAGNRLEGDRHGNEGQNLTAAPIACQLEVRAELTRLPAQAARLARGARRGEEHRLQ